MKKEELKNKWGGSLPGLGDWYWHGDHPRQVKHSLSLPLQSPWQPIPLTREVFLKIRETSKYEVLEIDENIDVCMVRDKVFLSTYTKQGENATDTHLPYLHQLQQLYRILTGGKELTYTP